jgi:hypothetical protein
MPMAGAGLPGHESTRLERVILVQYRGHPSQPRARLMYSARIPPRRGRPDNPELRVTVLRLRRRFSQLCREEVAYTVDDPDAVDEELHYLMRVIVQ